MAEKLKKKTNSAKKRKRFKYKKANAAKCAKCGRIVVSGHVHDFVQCLCPENESMFVDGGDCYHRRGYKDESQVIELPLYWRTDV